MFSFNEIYPTWKVASCFSAIKSELSHCTAVKSTQSHLIVLKLYTT